MKWSIWVRERERHIQLSTGDKLNVKRSECSESKCEKYAYKLYFILCVSDDDDTLQL